MHEYLPAACSICYAFMYHTLSVNDYLKKSGEWGKYLVKFVKICPEDFLAYIFGKNCSSAFKILIEFRQVR